MNTKKLLFFLLLTFFILPLISNANCPVEPGETLLNCDHSGGEDPPDDEDDNDDYYPPPSDPEYDPPHCSLEANGSENITVEVGSTVTFTGEVAMTDRFLTNFGTDVISPAEWNKSSNYYEVYVSCANTCPSDCWANSIVLHPDTTSCTGTGCWIGNKRYCRYHVNADFTATETFNSTGTFTREVTAEARKSPSCKSEVTINVVEPVDPTILEVRSKINGTLVEGLTIERGRERTYMSWEGWSFVIVREYVWQETGETDFNVVSNSGARINRDYRAPETFNGVPFKEWLGCGDELVSYDGEDFERSCDVSVPRETKKTIIAVYETTSYALDIQIEGEGDTTPPVGTHSYGSGTEISITADPEEGWEFSSWGGDCSGDGECNLVMDENKSVTATFSEKEYNLDIEIEGEGTVSRNPIKAVYKHGDEVVLNANPNSGWVFLEWGGDCSGVGSCTLIMDGDKTVEAYFAKRPIITDMSYEIITGPGDESPKIELQWEIEEGTGGSQKRFEIIVDGGSPTEYSSGSNTYETSLGEDDFGRNIDWSLRVQDQLDVWSNWNNSTFYSGTRFPTPDFTFDPENPAAKELVVFKDNSDIYVEGDIYYKWEFGDKATPQVVEGYGITEVGVTFESPEEGEEIKLTVTDSEGHSDSIIKEINIGLPYPEWEETEPSQSFFNFAFFLNLLRSALKI